MSRPTLAVLSFRTAVVAVLTAALYGALTPPARAQLVGDLNSDCRLDTADALLLERHLSGQAPIPGLEASRRADLAPLDANGGPDPDGLTNAADLLVLLRGIKGDVTLPSTGAATINNPVAQTSSNPIVLSGTNPTGASVRVFVNGVENFDPATVFGTEWTSSVALYDGLNTIQIQATVNGLAICVPATPGAVGITYTNQLPRSYGTTTITNDTVWTPGEAEAPYVVDGVITVAAGKKLTMMPGVVVEFESDDSFVVNGALRLLGDDGNRITFTSTSAVRGAWKGIDVKAPGTVIDYSRIEYAERGVEVFSPANVTISNNEIVEFDEDGIRLASGAGATIVDNLIANATPRRGDGIELDTVTGAVVIRGNTIRGARNGAFIERSSPQVIDNNFLDNDDGIEIGAAPASGIFATLTGNQITTNDYGVVAWSRVVLNGNRIYWNPNSSSSINLWIRGSWSNAASVEFNAKSNYWGSTDFGQVESSILHRVDDLQVPAVDYLPLADAFGAPIPEGSHQLTGLVDADRTLDTGTEYEVIGALSVAPGVTLTIPGATTLRFHGGNLRLVVDGILLVQGSEAARAVFKLQTSTPTRGGWQGIDIRAPGSVIDWARIEYAKRGVEVFGFNRPSNVTISNSQIVEFSEHGVRVDDTEATIIGNYIENTGTLQGDGIFVTNLYNPTSSVLIQGNTIRGGLHGIELERSSARVIGNDIRNCDEGMEIGGPSTSVLTGNEVTGNGDGIVLWAIDVVLNQNRIHANSFRNLWLRSGTASDDVDAKNNYWGFITAAEIETKIYHQPDSPSLPTAVYVPFLDQNSVPVGSNIETLIGTIPSNRELDPTEYLVVGSLSVPTGVTLTIPAGARLQFNANANLVVNGDLLVEGTANDRAVFTSLSGARGAWKGIDIRSPGTVIIEYARIEYAQRGIQVIDPGEATITNSEILEFSDDGIRVDDTEATIIGNRIENTGARQGDGIYLTNLYNPASEVLIRENTIRGGLDGIELVRSSPQIVDNIIIGNDDGIEVGGDCSPTLTGNEITANNRGVVLWKGSGAVLNENRIYENPSATSPLNLYAGRHWSNAASVVINAENNYWGAINPVTIEDTLYHRNDDLTSPTVDYLPFRNASDVQVPPGTYLMGVLDDATPLSANTTYDVLGWLTVPAGSTLTIPEGTMIRHHANTGIAAAGTLIIDGTSTNPVTLTSVLSPASQGDWVGIEIWNTSVGSAISQAVINWAKAGVFVTGTGLTIEDLTVQYFEETGIAFLAGATGSITGCWIDNFDQGGTGVHLVDSSPLIADNTVQNAANGFHLVGGSDPIINSNNVISSNTVGIRLEGTNGTGGEPNPTLTGNQLLSNGANVHSESYAVETDSVIDARGNWWGITDASAIRNSITDDGIGPTVIDFSNYLASEGGDPVPGTGASFSRLLSMVNAVPRVIAPTLGESSSINFNLLAPADVTLRIYAENDNAYSDLLFEDTQTLAAGSRSMLWNGTFAGGGIVPDEAYVFVLEASSGSHVDVHDPPRDVAIEPKPDWASIQLPTTANNFRNEYWKTVYKLDDAPGRATFRATPTGESVNYFIDNKPFAQGSTLVMFDGRRADGSIIDVNTLIGVATPSKVKPNTIIVERATPGVTGTQASPSIEVKSNPYLVYHSYEQFSRIVFRIDQNARVTVKILKPGFGDPGDPAGVADVLLDNVLLSAFNGGQPVDHPVTWWGHDQVDTNDISVAEEGSYTFSIEAVNPTQPDLKTVYRGVLTLRR